MSLSELAERCETARFFDRTLDRAIALATGWTVLMVQKDEWLVPPNGSQISAASDARRYTASIDAALTLVPEGVAWACGFGVDHDVENEHGWAWCGTADEPNQGAYHWGASIPLALCAAALRAREQTANNDKPF